jgi:hypothetical protein
MLKKTARLRDVSLNMTTYSANPDVVARRIRGESILVPIVSTMDGLDSIISLNETAEFIRLQAANGLDESTIIEALVATYAIEPDEARRDVALVLEELVALGVINKAIPS